MIPPEIQQLLDDADRLLGEAGQAGSLSFTQSALAQAGDLLRVCWIKTAQALSREPALKPDGTERN